MKIFYTRRDGNKQIFYFGLLLCLKTLAKLQNARGASGHPALMNNYTASSHMPSSYQSTNWFVISPFQVVCEAWDSVATRDVKNWHRTDPLPPPPLATSLYNKLVSNIWFSNRDFKVGLSPSKKNFFYLLQWRPFKQDKKCFLFHLKSFFRSPDI